MPKLLTNEILVDSDMTQPQLLEMGEWRLSYVSSRKLGLDHNEDAALIVQREGGEVVVAVADGAGGMRGGDMASSTAVHTLQSSLQRVEPLREAVLSGIEEANKAICDVGIGAITTLSVFSLHESELRTYHVGDSAIWVLGQRGKFKFQTVAHSPVGYALEAGYLDEQEALHHEERHLISNALGSHDLRIDLGSPLLLSRRDRVLVGSDGLFDNLSPQTIADIVRSGSLKTKGAQLHKACLDHIDEEGTDPPSKPDDVTFVLLERR